MSSFRYLEMQPGGSQGMGYMEPDVMIVTRNMLKPERGQRYHKVVGPNTLRMIKHNADKHQKSFYITNFFKGYIPPNITPRINEYRAQMPVFMEEIALVKPKRILITDRKLMKELIPNFKSIPEDHGTFFQFEFEDEGGRPHKVYFVLTRDFKNAGLYRFQRREIARDIQRVFSIDEPIIFDWKVIPSLDEFHFGPQAEVFIDFETTGVSVFDKITMAGIKTKETGSTVYIVHDPDPLELVRLGHRLGEYDATLIAHNTPFEMGFIFQYTQGQLPYFKTKDTMLMAHCDGQPVKNLEHCTVTLTDAIGSKSFGHFEDEGYLAQDVGSTELLYDVLEPRTREMYQAQVVQDLTYFTGKNNWQGVKIDQDQLEFGRQYLDEQIRENENFLFEINGGEFNYRSSDQATEFLQDQGIKLTERTKTGFSLGKETLARLAAKYGGADNPEDDDYETLNPEDARKLKIIRAFRAVKSFYSQRNSYLKSYIEGSKIDGAIHPGTSLSGTDTGRVSMKDPSLQTLMRKSLLKTVFISRFKCPQEEFIAYVEKHPHLLPVLDYVEAHADEFVDNVQHGFIGLCDLDQAELRGAALIANDRTMAKAMTSGDPHASNAQLAFPKELGHLTLLEIKKLFPALRKAAKRIVFSALYGAMPESTAKKENIALEHAKAVADAILLHFPGLAKYLARQVQIAEMFGKQDKDLVVTLPFGHKRDFSSKLYDFAHRWKSYNSGAASRAMKNTPIQGTAAGMMLSIWRHVAQRIQENGLKSIVLFNVHDSVLFDIHPLELHHIIEFVREGYYQLRFSPLGKMELYDEVPFTGNLIIGYRWSSVEKTCEGYYHRDTPEFPNCSIPDFIGQEIPEYFTQEMAYA